jgi:hypothetical protein
MPFESTNTVLEGSSWADFQTRTNKLTNATNVEVVRGFSRPGCDGGDVDIDLTYAVNSAGADVDFTQNTVISGLRYYKIRVTDGKGQEATGLVDVTATTTPINIDTSSLDASQTWCVEVILTDDSPGTNCACENVYTFAIGDIPSNPTDTITTADVVGALAIQVDVDGVKTSVADGGSQALTAASVGDVVDVRIYITNSTADSLVTISAATAVTDGSFIHTGYLPTIVNDSAEISAWVVRMDTASAGAKTCTVTFTSDDAASPYNFNLTLTVA